MQVNQHLHTSSLEVAVGNEKLNQLKKHIEALHKMLIKFGEETMEQFEEIEEELNVLLFEKGLLEAGKVLGNLQPLFRSEDISRLFDDDTPTDELTKEKLKKAVETQINILDELRVKTRENFQAIKEKLNLLLS